MNNPSNPKGNLMNSSDTGNSPLPQGSDPILEVTYRDVILGRGSQIQNHSGNVIFRQLVYLNKEMYVISTKFEKSNISKAIVRAVREAGGHFLEVKNGAFFDVGDSRAWYKTSQALREGQAEVRAQLKAEESRRNEVSQLKAGLSNQTDNAPFKQGKQIRSVESFLQYSRRALETLYMPFSALVTKDDENKGLLSAEVGCKPDESPQSKRRKILTNQGMIMIEQNKRFGQKHHLSHRDDVQSAPTRPCPNTQFFRSEGPNNHYQSQQGNLNQQTMQMFVPTASFLTMNVDTIKAGMSERTSAGSIAKTFGAAAKTTHDTPHASQQQTSANDPSSFDKNESFISDSTVTPQRKTLSTASETTSTEVNESQLERNLSDEIDEMIKRHSAALAEIGCLQAPEDLAFEIDASSEKSVSTTSGKEPEEDDETDE